MKLTTLTGALALPLLGAAFPSPLSTRLSKKQSDSSKVGYLAVYWTTEDESVYYALSSNDDPLGFEAINGGNAIVAPTLGTKAIRDTTIIRGEGDDEGKYYLIGTDLDIDTTNWGDASSTGSRAIFVWESTDLISWTDERLVTVEGETAGMAWAPDAIWDEEQGQYFVHWAAQLFAEDDPEHTGEPVLLNSLRYAYTSDFRTFTEPQTYISLDNETAIDLSFLKIDENTLVRYYVAGSTTSPIQDISTDGLFGPWTPLTGTIEDSLSFEAPYPIWSNTEEGKAYLFNDRVGGNPGVEAWESTDVKSGNWAKNSEHDLTFMRHLSILAVDQEQYDALAAL
ncbi:glycoside hydrolase family 43 protein [Aspergillus undulatus]|uniref:glycoside hydrolase family 43 protein n=1 Tax=Aspergillus undulatus TaxID=1810928 RepID=UPI003CCDFC28